MSTSSLLAQRALSVTGPAAAARPGAGGAGVDRGALSAIVEAEAFAAGKFGELVAASLLLWVLACLVDCRVDEGVAAVWCGMGGASPARTVGLRPR